MVCGLFVAVLVASEPVVATPWAAATPIPYPLSCTPTQNVVTSNPGAYELTKINNELAVERLQGTAALAHLENIKSRNPKAFAQARKNLLNRGFRPTNRVYVERTVRLVSGRPTREPGKALPVQDYSETNEDGEIAFWSWDDGDDGTWEGTIYVEVYSTGDASTWEGQIDATTEDHDWIYNQMTWEKPGVGDDPIRARWQPSPGPNSRGRIVPASLPVGPQGLQRGNPVPAGWIEWAECWRACVVGGCAAAALHCRFTNGAWPACWGAACVALEVGCAITCALAY